MSRLHAIRGLFFPTLEGIDLLQVNPADKAEIQEFWTSNPNLFNEGQSEPGSVEFFTQVDDSRKQTHWPLYEIVDFSQAKDLEVLEVGCGLGTDAAEFARSGAHYTGIDLTAPAVELTRKKLRAYGLPGITWQADAECLPFPDASFDLVYSWGVIHHTPDTEQCVAEIWRVLRPGGKLILMLYHAHGWWEYRIRHHWRIISRHIVPNILPLAFLYMMFTVTTAIGLEATLSFFGLIDVAMSWGIMIHTAQVGGYLLRGTEYWWLLLPAGVAVTLFAAAFYFVGRALDEVVNPRLRRR
jgi:SAM-dependent methyltransferase